MGREPWIQGVSNHFFQFMEESTDWGMRRVWAFRDNLLATERLIEAWIAPRWQLFLTKKCLGE